MPRHMPLPPYPPWPGLQRATKYCRTKPCVPSRVGKIEAPMVANVRAALQYHGIRTTDGPARLIERKKLRDVVLWHDGTQWQWGMCKAAHWKIGKREKRKTNRPIWRGRPVSRYQTWWQFTIVNTRNTERITPAFYFVCFPAGGFLVIPTNALNPTWVGPRIRSHSRWWKWWDRVDVLKTWPYLPDDLVDS